MDSSLPGVAADRVVFHIFVWEFGGVEAFPDPNNMQRLSVPFPASAVWIGASINSIWASVALICIFFIIEVIRAFIAILVEFGLGG